MAFSSTGLCAPGTGEFVEWLSGLAGFWLGSLCNEADRAVLESLFALAGGASWTNADGWGDDAVLGNWHGVIVDSLGRVSELDLTRNGLAGRLPPGIGELDEMTTLRVGGNELSGPLPRSLPRLSLVELHYIDTDLCAPAEASYRNWINGIASHQGTGAKCAPRSDRDLLVALYDATNGANWANDANWLTDAPLGDWYGVDTESSGRVVRLILDQNNLTGSMPAELGSLASLTILWLSGNALSGSIPPELGSLPSLEILWLDSNRLSGTIPPELGSLPGLETLRLSGNALSGPIPAELGNLASLSSLELASNRLSGRIPAELGSLASLERCCALSPTRARQPPRLETLRISGNALSGPIELGSLASLKALLLHGNSLSGSMPAELGSLASLETLRLDFNLLSGKVPEEFGRLASLRQLYLSHNSGMSGPLPAGLTDLPLEILLASATELCAPSDSAFQRWVETVDQRWIATCTSESGSMAYLTQAVQSLDHPIPLVAGEQALLRVFVTAGQPTTASVPAVRARFFLNGTETHVAEIPATMTTIPAEVIEYDLSRSVNAEIPGEIVQPGLEMVVEIDPDGTLDTGIPVAKRIPETGRMAIDVREMPVFDLTVIPFLWSTDPNRAAVAAAEGMEADPEGHELLWDTRTLLPIADLEVTAHEPVLTSSNDPHDVLSETRAIRALEDGRGHYMGMMSLPLEGRVRGTAYRPGRVSFAIPDASTMAHELGHNLSLQHAPCGLFGGQSDVSFPYRYGATGAWGYDFRAGGQLVDPSASDLMSYCYPTWVSDYHFSNALRYRLRDEGPSVLAARSLFLWGGTDAEGEPFLNPAFVVDATRALPDATGDHRMTGRTANGDELFVLDFAMPEVADGDGSSSFAFVVPVDPGWADNLASITLSGPGGLARLDNDTDIPVSILLDPNTGQVRGILRDLPQADTAAALVPQADPDSLDTLFSRGMPDAAAWER